MVLPIRTLQRRVTGNTRVNTLLVSMRDDADAERVKQALTQLLRERRKLAEGEETTSTSSTPSSSPTPCRAPPAS